MDARKTRIGLELLAVLAVVGCGRAEQGTAELRASGQALQNGPDFIVTAVTGPASVVSGQNLTAQVTVCNQGTVGDSANFELYLSADATIHADTSTGPSEDRFLGSGYTSMLNPGQCITLPVSGSAYPPPPTGPVPPSPEGAYYLGAVVDPRNTRPELIENNNTSAGRRIGVGSRADFIVTAVTGPASVVSGQNLTAQVTVCNQGTVSDSADFELYLSADATIHADTSTGPSEDRFLGSGYTSMLNPGQCVTLPVTGSAYPPPPTGPVPPSPEGAYYLGAVVDPRNTRPELIEDNNTSTGSRLGVGSRADFIVTAVTGPASVVSGQNLTAQVTVCNQGTVSDSANFELYLSADATIHADTSTGPSEDRFLGNGYTSMLNPGQCVTLPVSGSAYPPIGSPSPEGAYYLGAVVDPRNTRPELIEDNNTSAGRRLGVGSRADFIVTAVTGPTSVVSGQNLTAQVTVCNQGTVSDSASFELYLSADATIHADTSTGPSEDRFVGNGYTSMLNPGQCVTLPVSGSAYPPPPTGPVPSPEGAYYLGAVVDPRNTRPELIEDNNTSAGSRLGVGSRADFIVTAVTGPASVVSGQNLTAQVTVCNQGTVSDSANFELYLSADATIHADTSTGPSEDRFLGSGYTSMLNPGQCVTLPVTGSAYPPPPTGPVPPSPEGAYYLGAVVDPRNTRPELIEDNNTSAGRRLGVGSRADFIVTAVTGPASVVSGQNLTAQVTVCNQGTVSDSANFELYLSADATIHADTSTGPSEDRFLGNGYTSMLNPGQCVTLPVSGSAYPPPPTGPVPSPEGAYYLGAVVDPRNTRPELIEDNNTSAGSRLGVGSRADFIVTAVTGPSSVVSGQNLTAQVTVCNQGTVSDSANFELYLSADATIHADTSTGPSEDRFLGNGYTSMLNPGQCVTLPVSGSAYPPIGSPSSGGTYYLGAVVDPRNTRPELIEDNNATAGGRIGI